MEWVGCKEYKELVYLVLIDISHKPYSSNIIVIVNNKIK